jgi:hypothetical protein
MPLHPGETTKVARLFGFLLLGEQLAGDMAARQAALAPAPKLGRFLQTQAHQEAFHAVVFQGVIHWLAPRGLRMPPRHPSMERYRGLMESALARGDLAESLLALQVLLEAMGDVVLEAIDTGSERRGLGFRRLRRVLRQQEQTHHAFGVHQLVNLVSADATQRARLQGQAQNYLEVIDAMFVELEELFLDFDENPSDYRRAFQRRLPVWLAPA